MIRVEVVYSPGPGQMEVASVLLPDGSPLAAALSACLAPGGLLARHGLVAQGLDVGLWGRRQPVQAILQDGDRVEIYRPLRCDPKEARRRRQRKSAAAAAAVSGGPG